MKSLFSVTDWDILFMMTTLPINERAYLQLRNNARIRGIIKDRNNFRREIDRLLKFRFLTFNSKGEFKTTLTGEIALLTFEKVRNTDNIKII